MIRTFMKNIVFCFVLFGIVGCSGTGIARQQVRDKTATAGQADYSAYTPTVATATGQQFITPVTVGVRTNPTRYVSATSLYGELAGSPQKLPTDQLYNLNQVSFTNEGADFDVVIDPSGKFMVYASTRHRPTPDLYIKQIGGSTITQLTSDSASDTMPAISPDGQMVAFCSDRSGNWDIYVKKIAGGGAVKITDTLTQELHPSWSPDGMNLIFSALSQQSGQWEMVVVDVTKPAQRKSIGYGLFPQFSPDGKKIVYQKSRARGQRWFSVWTIDYVNDEGVRPTEIAASTNAAVINPCWSPDGKQLVFATVVRPSSNIESRPGKADLWKINIDGSGRTRLTTDHFVNLQPAWGHDGRIYFVSNRGGSDNIWALRAGDAIIGQTTQFAHKDQASAADSQAVAEVQED